MATTLAAAHRLEMGGRIREFDFAGVAGHVPGWLTCREGVFLFDAARRTGARAAIVEIGSFKGRSTLCLASGSREGDGAWVFAIDPHCGNPEHQRQFGPLDTLPEFTRNLEVVGLTDVVAILRDTSARVAARFRRPVGLLFVDGDHRYSAVREDLRRWLPLVTDGGLVAVHDSWQIWGPHAVTARHLIASPHVRRPRLIDTITCFEKTERASGFDRLQNLAFVIWRIVWGFKGFVSLKLTGTRVRSQPGPR